MYDFQQQCDYKIGQRQGYFSIFAAAAKLAPVEQLRAMIDAADNRMANSSGDTAYWDGVAQGMVEGVGDAETAYADDMPTSFDRMAKRLRELEIASNESGDLCERFENAVPSPMLKVQT